MMTADPLHRKLEKLVGDRFDFLGEAWVLIEVLADIDSVVLRRCVECGRQRAVQRNSYGMPNRRVDGTLTLPISDADSGSYSDDVLTLLAGRRRGNAESTGR
jgi:hypothetical protein